MNLDIDEDFPTHPKSVRLCAALQNPVAWAYMIKLWSWARKYQPDGDLSGYTPDEIEFSIGWTLADGKFYAAAVRAGFIDEHKGEAPTKAIHNWMQRTGGAIQRMEAGARAAKERRKNWQERERQRLAALAKASASRDGTLLLPSMDADEDAVPTVVVVGRNGLTKPNPTKPIRSGSGSPPDLEASAPDQTLTRSEGRAEKVWSGLRWLEIFGLRWARVMKMQTYGGGEDAAKAAARLGDEIRALPEAEAIAAQARASYMLDEFFADAAPALVKARYPFSWFVTRWNGLRAPAPQTPPAAPAPGRAMPPSQMDERP